MGEANFVVEQCDDNAYLQRGEFDIAAVAAFESAIEFCDPQTPITLKIAGLSFIDSSGVHALVRLSRRAGRAGGQVILEDPDRVVCRLLELTVTTEFFTIRGD